MIETVVLIWVVNLVLVVMARDMAADNNGNTQSGDPRYPNETGLHAFAIILLLSVMWPLYAVYWFLKKILLPDFGSFIEWLQTEP
jgi:uncharacterized protein HemY